MTDQCIEFKPVCWDPDAVRQILNTEAIDTPAEVFLATHYQVPIYKQEVSRLDRPIPFTQDELLDDFLNPDEKFRLIPVLGATGVGKTHFIRWVKFQIERRGEGDIKREVLLIKRAGTNLRDVLEMILALDSAQGPAFDGYRNQLKATRRDITEAEGKQRLLDELKYVVQGYTARSEEGEKDLPIDDFIKAVKQQVAKKTVAGHAAALLEDPFFRDIWLRREGVIEQFYQSILQRDEHAIRNEGPLQFELSDLPVVQGADPREVAQRASGVGRDAFRFLEGEEEQEMALEVLNDSLELALERVLNFSSADLLRLIKNVRRELAKLNIELVLLIEDISTVQGYDKSLIEAVILRSKEYGTIRTLMGCTDDYYNRLEDNIHGRIEPYYIDMNIREEDDAQVDIAHFSAQYLNAVRHGQEAIAAQLADESAEGVSSFCNGCAYSEVCHAAFGQVEGVGLYPFNSTALRRMYERVAPNEFNPRRLINKVLKTTLLDHVDSLRSGDFPRQEYLLHFGGEVKGFIDDIVKRKWQQQRPDEQQRRLALYELWSEVTDRQPRIHPDVLRIFGITVLDVVDAPAPAMPSEPVIAPPPEPDEVAPKEPLSPAPKPVPIVKDRFDLLYEALNNWSAKNKLNEYDAKGLRRMVHEAIVARIDWDAEGLDPTFFTSASDRSTPFIDVSIDFEHQITAGGPNPPVHITLPMPGQDETDVRLALKGLVRYHQYGHWRFENGMDHFLPYATCLDVWAQEILKQLRRPIEGRGDWDPSPLAAELLSIYARLSGRLMGPEVPLGERINNLLLPFSMGGALAQRDQLKALYIRLQPHHGALLDILNAHAVRMKGRGKASVYDVARFADQISSLEKQGTFGADLRVSRKNDLRQEYKPLYVVHEVLKRNLRTLLEQEAKEILKWLGEVRGALGKDVPHQEVFKQIQDALLAARDSGFSGITRSDYERWSALRQRLKLPVLAELISVAQEVEAAQAEGTINIGRLATWVGQMNIETRAVAQQFVTESDRLLDTALKRFDKELESRGMATQEGIEKLCSGIEEQLKELHAHVSAVHDRMAFVENT